MSAATRTKTATYSPLQTITQLEIASIDAKAAAGVARVDTSSGYKCVPLSCCGVCATAAGTFAVNVTTAGIVRFMTTNPHCVIYALDLPHAQTLKNIRVKFKPAVHGAGSAPHTQPRLRLYHVATTATLIASTIAAYSGAQYAAAIVMTLEVTCSTAVLTNTGRYHASIQNEYGTNSVAGMRILSVRANVTINTASGGSNTGPTFWM